jgi:cellulose synthase (UDP-forming)
MKRQVRLLPVFSRRERGCYRILVILWLGVNFYFWRWWLQQEHVGSPILYTLMSMALFYETTLLPSFYTFYLGQMRRPKHIPIIRSLESGTVRKVAMITLTVPGSESLEIVKRQLEAMRRVAFPHDSWILVDKCHSPEIKTLAESLGVKYFSRHDEATWGKGRVKRWNRPIPPFKAKTKAGNVNAWLNAFGREYSHFTQLDIDHVPHPQYLNRVLGYFLDDNVAWVQAPSIYGNMDDWTARGSTEQEFVLQGPLQMGFFGFCRTPFIIGSHCTYDMAAVLGIGGFQPTRAEDHLDTVCLAAKGKRGVFVPEVIAVGDGPENFETYLAQQFAWAYSMIQVMIHYTAKCLKKIHSQAGTAVPVCPELVHALVNQYAATVQPSPGWAG